MPQEESPFPICSIYPSWDTPPEPLHKPARTERCRYFISLGEIFLFFPLLFKAMSASAFRKQEKPTSVAIRQHCPDLQYIQRSTKTQQSSGFPMKKTLFAVTALLLELLHAPHTTGVISIFLNRTGIFKAPHLPSCSFLKVSSELLWCLCFGD